MLKTSKEIKRDILNKFRSQLENDDTISSKLWLKDYWQLLTTQEKGNFNKAVFDLIEKGLIDKVNSGFRTIQLTDKGADLIC